MKRLNEEQFRANRFHLVSRLADDLAHEIKNPLNAIVINLEVMKVRVVKGDAEAALERASVIEHETRRLHGLIDRLLQLLRPERDDTESLSLDLVMDELLPLVEAQIRLSRNELVVEGDPAVLLPVRRDVFKFAMLNVLIAVHEALGEGCGALAVTFDASDADMRILVEARPDDGKPIAAAAPASALREAAELSAALLASGGARVTEGGAAIEVRVPRASHP